MVDSGRTSNCENMASLAALEDANTVVETSLKMLSGTWISEGCETRPGPEYVIRSYAFEADGRFFLVQHHYWDDSCSSPQLTVFSYGKIQLRPSLVQSGAASGIFKITNITVVPQDESAAKELDRIVAMECPGQYWKSWRKYEQHTVYDNRYDEKKKTFNLWASSFSANSHHSVNSKGNNVHFSDISCLGSLKWAFNELKLLKIQMRPLLEHAKKGPREVKAELLLGDIHSNHRIRQYYNPTSFQTPLVKKVKDEEIANVNRHIYVVKNTRGIPLRMFNNAKTPPHLIQKPYLPPYIWGEWTSSRCESRPMNLYLTRRFSFYSEDETWIGEHRFFSDPSCKLPKFTVTAAGHFELAQPSKGPKHTTNVDFRIERATLTVWDRQMIDGIDLCDEEDWEVGVSKELSPVGGCRQLGIALPSVHRDVVKLEMSYEGACLLFLGQVDTDDLGGGFEDEGRPTAFQGPLVKCGEGETFSQGLRELLDVGFYYKSGGGLKKCKWKVLVSFVATWLVLRESLR